MYAKNRLTQTYVFELLATCRRVLSGYITELRARIWWNSQSNRCRLRRTCRSPFLWGWGWIWHSAIPRCRSPIGCSRSTRTLRNLSRYVSVPYTVWREMYGLKKTTDVYVTNSPSEKDVFISFLSGTYTGLYPRMIKRISTNTAGTKWKKKKHI